MDLSNFNTISVTDFRIRPGSIPDLTIFALVSCNLVKSDITNPDAIVYVATSFNHAIRCPGLYIFYLTNLNIL